METSKFRAPDFDPVTVLDGDLGIAAFGFLIGSLALFTRPEFRSIDMRAVQAAEIAQAGRGRIDFENEMVSRNLPVVREAGVTILHAPKYERVVFRECKDIPGIVAGVEMDFGAHGYGAASGRRAAASIWEQRGSGGGRFWSWVPRPGITW